VLYTAGISAFIPPTIIINHEESLVIIGVSYGTSACECHVDVASESFILCYERKITEITPQTKE
jgi:hypothetical protein